MPFARIQNDSIASQKLRFGMMGRDKPATPLADVKDLNLLKQTPSVGRKEIFFGMFPNGLRTVRRNILLTDSFGDDTPLKIQAVCDEIFRGRHSRMITLIRIFVL